MNIKELKKIFEKEGIAHLFSARPDFPPSDGYVLESEGGRWIMLYFERGESRFIASFMYEFDACGFAYWKLHDGLSCTGSSSSKKP